MAQPAEPPYTDPYVRWCDRESWRQPTYVDCARDEGIPSPVRIASDNEYYVNLYSGDPCRSQFDTLRLSPRGADNLH